MVSNPERIYNSFWINFPAKAKQMTSMNFIRRQENVTAGQKKFVGYVLGYIYQDRSS